MKNPTNANAMKKGFNATMDIILCNICLLVQMQFGAQTRQPIDTSYGIHEL
jgi:hypothetical protein